MSSLRFCVDSSIILPFLPLQIPTRSLAEYVVFGPKRSSLERLSRTQDPTKGQFNFFYQSLRPKTGHRSPAGLGEPMRVCILCLALGLCRAASWKERMHMHMFWHAPKLTQRGHRSPGSAMSAESSVGNVTNRAAKERQPW